MSRKGVVTRLSCHSFSRVFWWASAHLRLGLNGRCTSMTDPDGGVTTYTPDALNRWAQLNNPQGEVTHFNDYDALSRVTKKTLANGVVEKHSFDDAGREASIEYRTASEALLASFVSTYDNAGNRLSVTEADGSVTSYSYDADDQLLSEERTGTHPYFISYSYDALGNRTGKVENGVATTYVYAAVNRLMSEQTAGSSLISYGYDVLGQCTGQTQDGATTLYSWNPLGQMVSVSAPDGSVEQYSYCGDGIRRTKQTAQGTRLFIRDGHNILLEADAGTNATLRRYTHEEDDWGGLLSLDEGGTSRFYGFDGSANTRLLTDENSSVSDAYLYSAFGEELQVSGSSANPLRFGGEMGYYHDTMKRTYVRARHLDVGTGRWLSRDPLGFESGDWNLYRYIENSPLNHVDPSGLAAMMRQSLGTINKGPVVMHQYIRFDYMKCRLVKLSNKPIRFYTEKPCPKNSIVGGTDSFGLWPIWRGGLHHPDPSGCKGAGIPVKVNLSIDFERALCRCINSSARQWTLRIWGLLDSRYVWNVCSTWSNAMWSCAEQEEKRRRKPRSRGRSKGRTPKRSPRVPVKVPPKIVSKVGIIAGVLLDQKPANTPTIDTAPKRSLPSDNLPRWKSKPGPRRSEDE